MISDAVLADLGRIAYWSAGALLFLIILAETLWPQKFQADEKQRALHVGRNFGLWLTGMFFANVLFGIVLLNLQNRLTDSYFGPFHWFETPLVFDLLVGILLLDLAEYIFHRLSHSVRWMWLFHAVHHSDTQLDVTTAMRFHPGELIVNICWKIAVCFLLGLPLWLVGARGAIMTLATLFQHSNIAWPSRIDRMLRPIFITPGLHRRHHSPDPAENNTNFGEIFSFWDRIFGTYREGGQSPDAGYGLPRLMADRFQTLWGLIITPFSARKFKSL